MGTKKRPYYCPAIDAIKSACEAQGGFTCHWCNKNFCTSDLTTDHIIPLCENGDSSPTNIVPSCLKCNQLRGLIYTILKQKVYKKLKFIKPIKFYLKNIARKDPFFSKEEIETLKSWLSSCKDQTFISATINMKWAGDLVSNFGATINEGVRMQLIQCPKQVYATCLFKNFSALVYFSGKKFIVEVRQNGHFVEKHECSTVMGLVKFLSRKYEFKKC